MSADDRLLGDPTHEVTRVVNGTCAACGCGVAFLSHPPAWIHFPGTTTVINGTVTSNS